MYTYNKPAIKRNEGVLNYLSGQLYTIEVKDKTPDNYKYPFALIQAAQNQKQIKTGGLVQK